MFRSHFRTFKRVLLLPPSPGDVQSVIYATPVGTIASAINCTIYIFATWHSLGGPALLAWWAVSLLICATVFHRSLKARNIKVTRVSRRAARRLKQTSFALAIPWLTLGAFVFRHGNQTDIMLAVVVMAGMLTGGAMMLQRTLAAAMIYMGTTISGLILGGLTSNMPGHFTLLCYIVLSSAFVSHSAYTAGQTARQRDRMVARLSDANAALETAYKKISSFAYVDTVTGLPNRKAFTERILDDLAAAETDGVRRAVMLFDLDGFKNINDTYGHNAGDELLTLVGNRIGALIGDRGMVARLGGDEFAVIVSLTDAPQDLATLAEAMIQSVRQPAELSGRQVYPGTSLGVAILPDHGHTPRDLMTLADAALARAKEKGKGRWDLFDDGLNRKIADSNRLALDLTQALANGDITVHYQPQMSLTTGKIAGAEALVRWHHPTLGPIPPDQFLPVATERALLQRLSGFIFNRVTEDILGWRAQGISFGKVAINIHPIDLKAPDLLISRLHDMQDRGVGPRDVLLEITENCFVGRGTDTAPMILDAIADLGYHLSLDDFGTGHAALSHLRNLPVAEIKIDKEFVSNITVSPQDRAIVAATAAIAKGMGLRSVAEGVETLDQLHALQQIDTDVGQGFFWSRALPPGPFAEFARTYQPNPDQTTVPSAPPEPRRGTA